MASLTPTIEFDEPRPFAPGAVAGTAVEPGSDDEGRRPADLDLLVQYAREVSRSRLLTREEERELARRKEEGDEEATRRLIESNLRLVMWIVRGYASAGVPLLDLIQEGNLALMHAVDKFDYRQGCRFSTYATWWIRQAVAKAILYQRRTIRLPHWVAEQGRAVSQARARLRQSAGGEPTMGQLAREAGIPEDRVVFLLELEDDAVSLDAPAPDGQPLGDAIPDQRGPRPDEAVAERLRLAELARALERLSPRLRRVLVLRFGLEGETPGTLREVGESLGLTAERVRQLEMQALLELRKAEPALALYLEAS